MVGGAAARRGSGGLPPLSCPLCTVAGRCLCVSENECGVPIRIGRITPSTSLVVLTSPPWLLCQESVSYVAARWVPGRFRCPALFPHMDWSVPVAQTHTGVHSPFGGDLPGPRKFQSTDLTSISGTALSPTSVFRDQLHGAQRCQEKDGWCGAEGSGRCHRGSFWKAHRVGDTTA